MLPGARPHARRPSAAFVALAALCGLAPLCGCANLATLNVRASRAFSNESPNAAVVADRAADVVAVRGLVEQLLVATPFSPGDAWVQDLALGDKEGKEIKAATEAAPPYAGEDFEVPVVKLYRVHLQKVLKAAEAPRADTPAYPSLLDAAATLAPGASGLKLEWEAFYKAAEARLAAAEAESKLEGELRRRGVPMAPQARDPAPLAAAKGAVLAAEKIEAAAKAKLLASIEKLEKADEKLGHTHLAKDVLAGASVALRVELESLAVLPTIVVQAGHVADDAQRDLFGPRARAGGDADASALVDLPGEAAAIEAREKGELPVMEALVHALTGCTGTDRDATAGFALRESLVDQVVGVAWDSFRFHLKADGEVLFFHQLAASGGGDGDSYLGRTRRLEYHVQPIAMVGARLILAFDWIHLANAASLNGSFSTDRLFSRGGTIDNTGSLAQQLGIHGFVSDVVDMGFGLLGVRTLLTNATFTSGEVRQIAVDAATGKDAGLVDEAPLQLGYTQLDVAYDVAFLMPELAGRYWLEELLVGFRYMNYRLPRILYELRDTAPPGSGESHFVFNRESPPQTLSSKYYLGGATARFGQGEGRRVSLYGDIGLYGGAGPTSYYFLRDPEAGDTLANQEPQSPAALVFDVSASLGLRVRLLPYKSPLRLLLEAQYHGELVTQTIISEIQETQTKDMTTFTIGKKIDYGGTDVFHGPRLQIVGVF